MSHTSAAAMREQRIAEQERRARIEASYGPQFDRLTAGELRTLERLTFGPDAAVQFARECAPGVYRAALLAVLAEQPVRGERVRAP